MDSQGDKEPPSGPAVFRRPSPESAVLSLESVRDFLDLEIARRVARAKESAWPRWGVIAGCGGVAWALLDLTTSGDWTQLGCARAALLGIGLWTVASAIHEFVDSLGPTVIEPIRCHWLLEQLGGSRLWLVVSICVAAGQTYLLATVWGDTPWFLRVVPIAYVGAELTGALLTASMIHWDLDFPLFSGMATASPFRLRWGVKVALGVAMSWGFWGAGGQAGATDKKAAALALVLAFLLMRYAEQLRGDSRLEELEDLRSDLAARRAPPERVRIRAESIIDGVPLDGLLGREMEHVRAVQNELATLWIASKRSVAHLRECVDGHASAKQLALALEDFQSCEDRRTSATEKLEQAKGVLLRKYNAASRALPMFGVVLPQSTGIPVLERLMGPETEFAFSPTPQDMDYVARAVSMVARDLNSPSA